MRVAARNVPRPCRASGTSGVAPRRSAARCAARNTTSSPTPTTTAPTPRTRVAGAVSADSPPSSSTAAPAATTRPGTSSPTVDAVRSSGTRRAATTAATTAIGTLIRNTARHPLAGPPTSASSPPTIGPREAAAPSRPENAAIGRALSAGGYITWIRASTCGTITAAHSPCAARAPIRTAAEPARPHTSEVSANPRVPRTNTRRSPNMRPSRAPVIRPTANVRV